MSEDYKALCAELTEALCRWVEPWSGPEYETELVIKDVALIDRARAALAKPQPPADGEVAELVSALQLEADAESPATDFQWLTSDQLRRAADLLKQLAPNPAPVAKRKILGLADVPRYMRKNPSSDSWEQSFDGLTWTPVPPGAPWGPSLPEEKS